MKTTAIIAASLAAGFFAGMSVMPMKAAELVHLAFFGVGTWDGVTAMSLQSAGPAAASGGAPSGGRTHAIMAHIRCYVGTGGNAPAPGNSDSKDLQSLRDFFEPSDPTQAMPNQGAILEKLMAMQDRLWPKSSEVELQKLYTADKDAFATQLPPGWRVNLCIDRHDDSSGEVETAGHYRDCYVDLIYEIDVPASAGVDLAAIDAALDNPGQGNPAVAALLKNMDPGARAVLKMPQPKS